MATQFLSAKPRPSLLGALTDHIIGKTRPKSAKRREGLEPIVHFRPLMTDPEELTRLLAEAYKKTHHRSGHAVEILFTGPPSYEAPAHPGENATKKQIAAWEAAVEEWAAENAKWPQERRLAWAEDSIAWFEKYAPWALIICAVGHQDENSFHVHVVAAPRTSTGGLAWTRLQAEMWQGPGAKSPQGKALSLSGRKFQDLYHTEVGSKYGLGRGGDGPAREATPLKADRRQALADEREDRTAMADQVQKRKAAERKLDEALRAKDRARAGLRKVREIADKALAERDEARDQLKKVRAERNWLLSGMRWVYTQLPAKPARWLRKEVRGRLGLDVAEPAPDHKRKKTFAEEAASRREQDTNECDALSGSDGGARPRRFTQLRKV